jgi:hypothetical protein
MIVEVVGNRDGISIGLTCHREDLPIVLTAFEGTIEHCMLTPLEETTFDRVSAPAWSAMRLRDYYPEPPYHHLLTRPEELQACPYEGLIAALLRLEPPAVGLYQVLFQPVSPDHAWHLNVQLLTDWEYLGRQVQNQGIVQRYAQSIPSEELHHTADKLESKAHNDKPFFAVAVRIAVAGSTDPSGDIRSLTTFANLFQHGGQALRALTDGDYAKVLSPEAIYRMLTEGVTYRPGFLLNSDELTGLIHVPPVAVAARWESVLDTLEPLAGIDVNLAEGTPIGTSAVADREQLICISPRMRGRHIHIIGRPDMGKSSLLESMILDDIAKGHGVAVLDPHGDLVARLLSLIPQEAVTRTIYFCPGDPDWVPLWNPMSRIPGQDLGRMADDFVRVIKSFVTGWGDRLEHILRHGIFALLHLPGATLLDLSDLLRNATKETKEMQDLLLRVVQNEAARKYWRYDHANYKADEFGPPKNKLSKLLVGGTPSLMLSQPCSSFSWRHVMDDGQILLADLSSNLGTEVRNILGGLILAIMHVTALSRSDTPPEKRRPFYAYLDEAHRFVTDCLEDMLVETRKFGVHLVLAHQYMRQFTPEKADALASVGSTIAFSVDARDAEHLAKTFRKAVDAEDFQALETREALVRIGNDMAKIRTLDRMPIPEVNFRNEIIEQAHRKYCLPVAEVQERVRHRHPGHGETFSPLVPSGGNAPSVIALPARLYDEL